MCPLHSASWCFWLCWGGWRRACASLTNAGDCRLRLLYWQAHWGRAWWSTMVSRTTGSAPGPTRFNSLAEPSSSPVQRVMTDQCDNNCSFVSGHVACGFFYRIPDARAPQASGNLGHLGYRKWPDHRFCAHGRWSPLAQRRAMGLSHHAILQLGSLERAATALQSANRPVVGRC
jgi:hypothetical protein